MAIVDNDDDVVVVTVSYCCGVLGGGAMQDGRSLCRCRSQSRRPEEGFGGTFQPAVAKGKCVRGYGRASVLDC